MSAAGGTKLAITASTIAPPPIPIATVIKDPTKLAAKRKTAVAGSRDA
jgi:hypothetical protein